MAERIFQLAVTHPPELIVERHQYLGARFHRPLPGRIRVRNLQVYDERSTAGPRGSLRHLRAELGKIVVQKQRAGTQGQVGVHDSFTVFGQVLVLANGAERLLIKSDSRDSVGNDQMWNGSAVVHDIPSFFSAA